MEKTEDVEKEYHLKRRSYEEQENDLIRQRNKGIETLEEVQDRSRHYLKDFVSDSDILTRGFRQIEQMKREILEMARADRQNLARKLEKLDEDFYSEMKKLSEKEEKGDYFKC
ncbi:hypothetical protein JSQ81_05380 [Sporosarcina sp. Marseille-Q4063]|uniref:hypothetical protein n=1 Tax=Sporosarcina sp. Marseille-Q4063 TaxID=2810514 RepID=UPI001BAEDFD9|nr:hypothetical protein [Sporosarcina sp. Marseille-Q4063]QUW23003.1 hypothetical protein JSQ81_05380 [Sporosarcina sp. Marseille-Q4063]